MWHVDDGALHAYLDGALDALPATEAARVREHVAACAACAARLEEERALRAEAEAILAGAVPEVGSPPALEDLRNLARARRRGRPGVRLQRLAWAASVVVAVGAGWMLRGSQGWRFTETTSADAMGPGADASSEVLPPGGGSPQAVAEAADRAVGGAEAAGDASAPAAAGQVAASTVQPPPAVRATAQAEPRDPTAPAPSVPAEVEARVAEGAVADTRVADEQRRTLAAARERVAALAEDRPEPAGELRARGGVVGVSAAAAAGRVFASEAPASVMVPGLPVLDVRRADAPFPEGTLRVLQRLDGDTLELLHLPPGSEEPSGDANRPDGRTEAVVPLGGGWLLGRARVAPERLRALLALVPGAGG